MCMLLLGIIVLSLIIALLSVRLLIIRILVVITTLLIVRLLAIPSGICVLVKITLLIVPLLSLILPLCILVHAVSMATFRVVSIAAVRLGVVGHLLLRLGAVRATVHLASRIIVVFYTLRGVGVLAIDIFGTFLERGSGSGGGLCCSEGLGGRGSLCATSAKTGHTSTRDRGGRTVSTQLRDSWRFFCDKGGTVEGSKVRFMAESPTTPLPCTTKDERNEENDDSQTNQATNYTTCNGARRTSSADAVVNSTSSNGRTRVVNIRRGNIAEGAEAAFACGGWAGDNGRGGSCSSSCR